MNTKYKIGVFGSGNGSLSEENIKESARQLGRLLGEHASDVIVVTGASAGLPYQAAYQAAQGGVEVWGFSSVLNMAEQKEFTPEDDLSIYARLHFMSQELPFITNRRMCTKYRNVLSTATCDAGIIISGRWGTLNEFTNLVDMRKTVGVLTGTGGVADELPDLEPKFHKDGQGTVIFNDDPKQLLDEILRVLSASKIA